MDAAEMDAATKALLEAEGWIACPAGCGTLVEPLAPLWHTGLPGFDRTPPAETQQLDASGRQMTREQRLHLANHRFRCPGCSASFCSACLTTPYHLDTCNNRGTAQLDAPPTGFVFRAHARVLLIRRTAVLTKVFTPQAPRVS